MYTTPIFCMAAAPSLDIKVAKPSLAKYTLSGVAIVFGGGNSGAAKAWPRSWCGCSIRADGCGMDSKTKWILGCGVYMLGVLGLFLKTFIETRNSGGTHLDIFGESALRALLWPVEIIRLVL